MPDRFSWDDLRLVLAVADGRGLAPAAERLGIDGSTVFRRLGQLETRLGVKLFERHRTGYAATEAGEDMAALARRMDEEVSALSRRLAGGSLSPRGEVRLTTNDTMLGHGLGPILARVRQRHPAITLDLVVSNDALNLSRRDADIALRATDRPPETLVGRRIASIGWAVYGRRGSEPAGSDGSWTERDWVALSEEFADVGAATYVRRTAPPERIACRVNTVLAAILAVEAGLGIAPLPCFAADQRPDLVRLGPPDPALATSLWLLTHPDLREAPRIRAVMDVLADGLSGQRKLFAGA